MVYLICAIVAGLLACSGRTEAPVRETVLKAGQSLEATNRFGAVRVTYISPVKRKYEWDDETRVVKLIPRPERFLGEMGIYEPAGCFIFCRTPRLVLEEAYHDFPNYDQLYAFVYQGSSVMDWVYTSDGLLVGFGRSPAREQINVDVRQLTVRGRKPIDLRGARDADIHLIQTSD